MPRAEARSARSARGGARGVSVAGARSSVGICPFPFKTLTSGSWPPGRDRENPGALEEGPRSHALGFIADARFECLLLRI